MSSISICSVYNENVVNVVRCPSSGNISYGKHVKYFIAGQRNKTECFIKIYACEISNVSNLFYLSLSEIYYLLLNNSGTKFIIIVCIIGGIM